MLFFQNIYTNDNRPMLEVFQFILCVNKYFIAMSDFPTKQSKFHTHTQYFFLLDVQNTIIIALKLFFKKKSENISPECFYSILDAFRKIF